jgi:hypothetical protein
MHTEFLFSYGTLQLEAVQMATFGRQLSGTSDALREFDLVLLKIEDKTVVAISGKAHHTMAPGSPDALPTLYPERCLLSRQMKFRTPTSTKWRRSSEWQ